MILKEYRNTPETWLQRWSVLHPQIYMHWTVSFSNIVRGLCYSLLTVRLSDIMHIIGKDTSFSIICIEYRVEILYSQRPTGFPLPTPQPFSIPSRPQRLWNKDGSWLLKGSPISCGGCSPRHEYQINTTSDLSIDWGHKGYFLVPGSFNTLRPRQYGRRFPDDIFKSIFYNENVQSLITISWTFVPKSPINYIPALVQIMVWRRPGDKPLSEPIMVRLPTHICVTRPQWVNKLMLWCRVTHIGVIEMDHRRFGWWPVACSAPRH